jgi:hypothetical protein
MIHKFCFRSDPELSQLAKARFTESNPEVLAHRTRAIHLINKKLNEEVASETIIANVLVLLLHHLSFFHTFNFLFFSKFSNRIRYGVEENKKRTYISQDWENW